MPTVTVNNVLPVAISVKYFYAAGLTATQTVPKNNQIQLAKPVVVNTVITVSNNSRAGHITCTGDNDTNLSVNYGLGQNDLALNWDDRAAAVLNKY